MKRYIYILFFSLLPSLLFAQKDFCTTSVATFTGIRLTDGGDLNFKVCQIKGDKGIRYTPDQIVSYGFSDKRFFKSFTIDVKGRQERYFLQLLIPGKVNLYYAVVEGEKKYFLTDSIQTNPVEVPSLLKNDQSFVGKMLADCPPALKNIPFVRTRKNDLMRYIKDYNSCTDRPLLRNRYGFQLGATSYNMTAVDYRWLYPVPGNLNFMGYSFGAFADIPFSSINLSFHPELNFEHFSTTKAFLSDDNYDLVLNSTSVSIPVYLRYTVLKNFLSPYFQAGPVYSRSIHNSKTLYQYDVVGKEIFTSIIDSRVLQDNMAGYSFGAGVISHYGSKYSWFAEANFCKTHNLKTNTNIYQRYEIAFKIGMLF